MHLDNDAFAERVPHELFARMRDEAPVLWYDWEYGNGFWSVTRYDDIVTVLKDWRTYSSEIGGTALEDLDRRSGQGAQVDARRRPARALQPARDRQQGLHPPGRRSV